MANKTDMKFIDTSGEVKKTLEGLSKTALRKSAAIIRKELRKNVPIRTRKLVNHIASWVFIERRTGQPQMQIGFYSWQRVKKRGKEPSGTAPHWVEFGTGQHAIVTKKAKALGLEAQYGRRANHPGQRATHVLRNTVQEKIPEIKNMQVQYLSEMTKALEEAGVKVEPWEEMEESE